MSLSAIINIDQSSRVNKKLIKITIRMQCPHHKQLQLIYKHKVCDKTA